MKRLLLTLWVLFGFSVVSLARPDDDAPPPPPATKDASSAGVALEAIGVYDFLFAALRNQGYVVECTNPRAWHFDTDDWSESVDGAIAVIEKLEFGIREEGFLETNVAFIILDINPDDPRAFGVGILLVGSFSLQDCQVSKP